jgi:hypothetical protein
MEVITEALRGHIPAEYFRFVGKSIMHKESKKIYDVRCVAKKRSVKLAHFVCHPHDPIENALIILCNSLLAKCSSFTIIHGKAASG